MDGPATSNELALELCLGIKDVRARLYDLVQRGRLCEFGRIQENDNGSPPSIIYALTKIEQERLDATQLQQSATV